MTTLKVYGYNATGKQFTAGRKGTYRFTYVDGAYAQGPLGGFPEAKDPWLTGFVVFDGSKPIFTGKDELNRDFLNRQDALVWAVDNGYKPTVGEAKAAAMLGPDVEIKLEAGQVVTVVCIEARDYYFDNIGSITIDVSYVT